MFNVIPAFWQRRAPAGGDGSFTLYTASVVPSPPRTVMGDPLIQRNLFVARLLSTVGVWNFEEETSPGSGVLVYPHGTYMHNVNVVRNGVSMNLALATSDTSALRVYNFASSGRFNTTQGTNPFTGLPYKVYLNLVPADSTNPTSFTFASPISFFGFYGTDFGDFLANITITLHKSGGGTVDYPVTVVPTDSNLVFWGFVDTTGTTYDKIVMSNDLPVPDTNKRDLLGLDDIYWGPVSYIIP